jgi:hypothetical protein
MKIQGGFRVVTLRVSCRLCASVIMRSFSVPDDTWEKAVPFRYWNDDLCVKCFEGLVCDKQIELFHSVRIQSDPPTKPTIPLTGQLTFVSPLPRRSRSSRAPALLFTRSKTST